MNCKCCNKSLTVLTNAVKNFSDSEKENLCLTCHLFAIRIENIQNLLRVSKLEQRSEFC